MGSTTDLLLEMRGIDKSFPGVHALDNVSFTLRKGEVHALVGENGAGKSTLMKILTGVYSKDSGDILLHGQPVDLRSPAVAQGYGIAIIPQELSLVPQLSAAENMYMGRLAKDRLGLVDWAAQNREAAQVFETLDLKFSPTRIVGDLPVAEQQMVAIAKALCMNAELLIMDEPTSSITERESEHLFETILRLKKRGVSVIYISHRLEEIFRIADAVTVLRDGKVVSTLPVSEAGVDKIITMMVGRDVAELFPKTAASIGQPLLEVRHLSREGVLHDVSFALHSGEILGLAGLVGAGRSELARLIYGIDRRDSGEILVDGKPVTIRSAKDAIALGIGFAPEERRKQGLVLGMSVGQNTTLAVLPHLTRMGVIDLKQERTIAQTYRDKLAIRSASLAQRVLNLSGGNQQKVVIAKWLATKLRVLILDEPTRGIDVGAKAEIRRLMCELAAQGTGILLISSELPEVMEMSDRVLVICEGRMTGEFVRGAYTPEDVMRCALGQPSGAAPAAATV